MVAYLLLGPDELEAFTAGSPVNTDDNARIEFAAPRDLLGYAKFDPYLAKVYGPMWPYGRLTELVRGYDGPDESSALRRGWRAACWRTARRARRSCGRGARRRPAIRPRRGTRACCCDLVSTRLDRDPEIPLAPGEELAPPVVPATLAAAHPELVAKREGGVPGGAGRTTARAATRPPTRSWRSGPRICGPGWARTSRCCPGSSTTRPSSTPTPIDELKALADDAAYVARRPELLYYLGRSYYANAQLHQGGRRAGALHPLADACWAATSCPPAGQSDGVRRDA